MYYEIGRVGRGQERVTRRLVMRQRFGIVKTVVQTRWRGNVVVQSSKVVGEVVRVVERAALYVAGGLQAPRKPPITSRPFLVP
jgi:hypothetical protein